MPKLSELIPTCIGDVEAGDVTCDGDPQGKTEQERAPCSWRDRCTGFQLHLRASGENASDRIKLVSLTGHVKRMSGLDQTAQPVGMTVAQFTRFCRGALERYAPPRAPAPAGGPAPAPARARAGSVAARPHAGGQARRTAGQRSREMKARRAYFHARRARLLARLEVELPGHIQRRAAALRLPGQLHVDTDWERHQCTVYVRRNTGLDVGIVRMVYKPSSRAVDLFVCSSKRHIAAVVSRATLLKLAPEATVLNNFHSVVKGADDEAISLVAEAIGRLVKSGNIELSGVKHRQGKGARRGS